MQSDAPDSRSCGAQRAAARVAASGLQPTRNCKARSPLGDHNKTLARTTCVTHLSVYTVCLVTGTAAHWHCCPLALRSMFTLVGQVPPGSRVSLSRAHDYADVAVAGDRRCRRSPLALVDLFANSGVCQGDLLAIFVSSARLSVRQRQSSGTQRQRQSAR